MERIDRIISNLKIVDIDQKIEKLYTRALACKAAGNQQGYRFYNNWIKDLERVRRELPLYIIG